MAIPESWEDKLKREKIEHIENRLKALNQGFALLRFKKRLSAIIYCGSISTTFAGESECIANFNIIFGPTKDYNLVNGLLVKLVRKEISIEEVSEIWEKLQEKD